MLLDSGSDLNLIKLSSLKDDVIVYDQAIYELKGINEHLVYTLGNTTITFNIGEAVCTEEFHVVHDTFPVPNDGILGRPFIVGQQAILNYGTNELVFSGTTTITLQPRTETVITAIAEGKEENSSILVVNQELTESVTCGNIITTVQNQRVKILLINPTEKVVNISTPSLKQLVHEDFYQASISVAQKKPSIKPHTNGDRLLKLRESLRTEHLNQEEQESLGEICETYSDVFFVEGDKITATNAVFHEIRTPETVAPIHEKPYRLPQRHRQEITEQMKALERDGVIAPSDSPWNAPLLVVPKKPDVNGVVKYRVCVDFRRLNEITVGDAFPLPNIVDILDQLGKSKYYSTLDLAQGYHQVPMKPADREKTAFSTDKGHYEFLRMPFGLKGAPGTFQRLMNKVLIGLNGLKAFVYLDDIIIYAKDLNDHSNKLREIFQRLRQYNLKLQPLKCEFLRKEVTYLGHLITDEGVKPEPNKIECVKNFPIPKNTKEVKSFLGLSGYYRRFIQNYGQVAKPLTMLLKKDIPYQWSDQCQHAFETLKGLLTQAPILQYPDFNQTFNLTCDASNYAIGCVLSQGPIGKDLPIAFASRTLNKAEINYNTTEKELSSIVWGIKVFRPYLFGQKFNVITDHRALTWLFNLKDPGSRLTRWRLKLEEYQYTILYKPGTANTNADALSRIHKVTTRSQNKNSDSLTPENSISEQPEHITSENSEQLHFEHAENPTSYEIYVQSDPGLIKPTCNVTELFGNLFDLEPDVSLAHCVSADFKMMKGISLQFRRKFGTVDKLRQLQKTAPDVALIETDNRTIFYLITKEHFWQKPSYEQLFYCLQKLKQLCEENNISKLACPRLGAGLDGLKWEKVRSMLRYLFRNSTIYLQVVDRKELSEEERIQIISEFHNNPLGGHQGIARTYQRVSQQYQWKGMRQQIKNYVLSCTMCQVNKSTNRTVKEPMVITTTSSRPFEKIFLDIVGPLPKSHKGNVYILTLLDDLSKFA